MRRGGIAISSLGLLLLGTPAAAEPAVPEFSVVENWPGLPDDFEWGKVSAVAADAQGRVYVGHRGDDPIVVLSPLGEVLRRFGNVDIPRRRAIVRRPAPGTNAVLEFVPLEFEPGRDVPPEDILADETLRFIHGLFVDTAGHVWVTDLARSVVLKYNQEGTLLMVLGSPDDPGDNLGQFNQPTDVAVNSHGEIYVADGYVNSRVVRFASDGQFLGTWGRRGEGEGEFNTPHALVIDEEDRVMVSDRENRRVQIFDREGKWLASWNGLGLVGVGVDQANDIFLGRDGLLYVGTGRGNQVVMLDDKGQEVGRLGNPPSTAAEIFANQRAGPGRFNVIHGLCLDPAGNLFVAEPRSRRVQKFLRIGSDYPASAELQPSAISN